MRGFTAVPGKGAACGSVMSGRKAMLETVKRDFTAVTVRNATLGSVKRDFTGVTGRKAAFGSVPRPSISWGMKIVYPCLNFLQSPGANPYSSPARKKKKEKMQFSVT